MRGLGFLRKHKRRPKNHGHMAPNHNRRERVFWRGVSTISEADVLRSQGQGVKLLRNHRKCNFKSEKGLVKGS